MYNPGDDNIPGYVAADDNDEEKTQSNEPDPVSDKKPLSEKIHEALQDWSNKDQADQDFDDTRP